MLEPSARKSYGPFPISNSGNRLPGEFLTLQWSKVRGANVFIAVIDDVDINLATAGFLVAFALCTVEVTIFGTVQGFAIPLKTTTVRMKTGPVTYLFPEEEGYENVIFTARPFIGGKPQGPNANAASVGQQAGLSIKMQANVYVMPRGGFSEKFDV